MSKVALIAKAEPPKRWATGFLIGLVRGVLTIGATGVLTAFVLLLMQERGMLHL